MPPAVRNRVWCDCGPGCLHHEHALELIDLVYVLLSCLILLDCSLTESPLIMCLEGENNACVKRLYKWCHIWLEMLEVDVYGLIVDLVAREIVNRKKDLSFLLAKVMFLMFHPSLCSSAYSELNETGEEENSLLEEDPYHPR